MADFAVAIFVFLLILALSCVSRFLYLARRYGKPSPKRGARPCKTMIVVGAGGHGMEMTRLLSSLNTDQYKPRIYIIAQKDAMSRKKVERIESDPVIWGIMRAREVGQSYISSVFTTLGGFVHSLPLIFSACPELILCNGPGTCIPVCLAGYLFKFFGFNSSLRLVYVESVCRTEELSLSAKLLYHFFIADEIIVQWPQLTEKYTRTKYLGRLF